MRLHALGDPRAFGLHLGDVDALQLREGFGRPQQGRRTRVAELIGHERLVGDGQHAAGRRSGSRAASGQCLPNPSVARATVVTVGWGVAVSPPIRTPPVAGAPPVAGIGETVGAPPVLAPGICR